jgi:PIN domain nuclease of toxin-antitoxin system
LKLLLDTHALLWWQARSRKLSRRAAAEMSRSDELLVSAITCWEVATLLAHGRIELDRSLDEWLDDMDADEKVTLVPLGPHAAIEALALDRAGFHADPADRLIYATAIEQGCPLVTADDRIHDFVEEQGSGVRLVW